MVGSHHGVVRFIGDVHFGTGLFIGVELDTPEGKNDGSIDGTVYFTTEPNRGLFTRPNRVTLRGVSCEQLLAA